MTQVQHVWRGFATRTSVLKPMRACDEGINSCICILVQKLRLKGTVNRLKCSWPPQSTGEGRLVGDDANQVAIALERSNTRCCAGQQHDLHGRVDVSWPPNVHHAVPIEERNRGLLTMFKRLIRRHTNKRPLHG